MVDEAVWRLISGFGDSGVTLPLVLAVAICLAWGGTGRMALALVLPVAGCGAALAGLKLLFGACGGAIAGLAQASPSGHVAMSAAVYGGLALLLARGGAPPRRWLAAVLAGGLVALIAVSRVRLGAHSSGEVLAGLGLGLVAVAVEAGLVRGLPPGRLALRWPLTVAALVLIATYGVAWPVERHLRALAQVIRAAVPGCW